MGPRGRARRRRFTNLPLIGALVLALAMLIGHQFPATGGGSDAYADSPQARAERAAARVEKWMRPLAPGERPPQFVIFSFDGAGSHEHWQQIMDRAGAAEAHVTGFLSGVYLLDDSRRARYRGPGHPPGKSSIGFGGSPTAVRTLSTTSTPPWRQATRSAPTTTATSAAGPSPVSGPGRRRCGTTSWTSSSASSRARARTASGWTPRTVRGGRTPCLEGNWDAAVPAMVGHGLTYDTSRTSDGIAWPSDEGGIREFWMPRVRIPALGKKVILMDYNLWFSLNGARDEPARAAEFAEVTLEAYRAAYDAAARGNRAPLVIGNHFNEWSGGGFSAAAEQFVGEACLRPEAVCATYGEVSRWMDLQDPAVLDALRREPNAQVPALAPPG